tara:strand:+ start:13924 stop:15219 length:1296 start_codon:yes stop_codon:yes gene_type:complete
MNEYDSNRILDIVKKINYNSTKKIEEASCYLLNTCHIREKATEKVYHEIGRVKKKFRNKKKPIVLITGCVAQAEGEILLEKEKYIDAVIGPQSYHEINKIILNIQNKKKDINYTNFDTIEKFDELKGIKNNLSRASSFLTIQEGCDKFCKFCVVPYTRGPEYSRPIHEIVEEAKQLVMNGSIEVILLGQNVNAYNFKNKKLSDLIYLLSEIKDLQRIRYTTSHPNDFTEDLIEAHKNCKKLMPLLHLPVQSGSNKILKEMNRNHTAKDYLELIEALKDKNPLIKFSSDFIIAYPGETRNDFEETLFLMKKIKFINSYSFVYSARPGTPAANMETISDNIAKDRLKTFQELAENIKKEYRKNLVGTLANVLFENKVSNENKFFGRDEYFNSVIVESNEDLVGKIKKIKIQNYNKNTLFGEKMLNINEKEYAA